MSDQQPGQDSTPIPGRESAAQRRNQETVIVGSQDMSDMLAQAKAQAGATPAPEPAAAPAATPAAEPAKSGPPVVAIAIGVIAVIAVVVVLLLVLKGR